MCNSFLLVLDALSEKNGKNTAGEADEEMKANDRELTERRTRHIKMESEREEMRRRIREKVNTRYDFEFWNFNRPHTSQFDFNLLGWSQRL